MWKGKVSFMKTQGNQILSRFNVNLLLIEWLHNVSRGRHGRDLMVVGYTCTTLCDKVCQWHAAGQGFLRVLWFPPPIKLTNNWNIVESGVKHHKPTNQYQQINNKGKYYIPQSFWSMIFWLDCISMQSVLQKRQILYISWSMLFNKIIFNAVLQKNGIL